MYMHSYAFKLRRLVASAVPPTGHAQRACPRACVARSHRKRIVIDLHQTRAFLAVAEELHFGRAAERLGIAQPPLSRTIRQLENRLGVQLFNRTTRFVSLTPAGSALVGPAREILESVERAEHTVKLAEQGDVGTVRLGFSAPSGHMHIPKLIKAVHDQKPGIKIDLHGDIYSTDGTTMLLEGKLDLALIRVNTLPPRLKGRPVTAERHIVILPKDHHLADREKLTIEDLREEKLIILPANSGSAVRENLMHWSHEAGFKPKIAQTVPDSPTMSYCVDAGVGVAVNVESALVDLPGTSLVTVPLDVGLNPVPLLLVHHEEHESPALRKVIDIADDLLPRVDIDV